MSKQRNPNDSQAGFSLLEMMTVIIIIMIMMVIAIPLLLRAIQAYQMEGAARSVASLITRARYEAQRRNTRTCTAFVPSAVPGELNLLMNTIGPGADPCAAPPAYDNGEVYYVLPRNLTTGGPEGSATCPITGMPTPWAFSAVGKTVVGVTPPNFQVNLSARGTMEIPGAAPGTWRMAREIEYFCLISPITAANADTADSAFMVYLEPTGKVRLFRRQGRRWVPLL